MSKTLVIHPEDKSTDFLKLIYEGKGYDVITDQYTAPIELARAIDLHDKVIMLGHGTPLGLLSTYPDCSYPYLVDERYVDLLKEKETISIWCYSNLFFNKYSIPGLHTGMIISETVEQYMMLGKVYLDAEAQWANMERFSKAFGECIEMDPKSMQNYMMEHYTGDDLVTQFNRKNIIVL